MKERRSSFTANVEPPPDAPSTGATATPPERSAAMDPFRLFFEAASDAQFVLEVDRAGHVSRITHVNEAACQLLGYTRAELLQVAPAALVAAQEGGTFPGVDRLAEPDQSVLLERILLAKDGRSLSVEVNIRVFRFVDEVAVLMVARDVSERKRAQEALLKSEELFRLITENTSDVITIHRHDGTCVYASPSLRRVLGYDPAAFMGVTSIDQVHSDDRSLLARLVQRMMEGEPVLATWRHRHANGTWRWLEASATTFARGARDFALCVGRDVTARKELEQELLQSRERFQRIFQSSPVPICITNLAHGRFRDVNEAFLRTMEFGREEVIGRSWGELNLCPDPEELARLVADVLQNQGSAQSLESRFRTKMGDIRVFLVSVEFIELAQESCLIFICSDITDRKEAEERLRRKEASLVEAQRIGCVGSWELDLVTGFLEWSEETYRIFGRSPRDFAPTIARFYEAVHPEDRSRVRHCSSEAARAGTPYQIEHRILRPDGTERIVYEQAELVRDPEQCTVSMIGTVQDITERKHLEAQLRQSQKMESVGRLAGGIAHDFNNILTVIQGHSALLLDGSLTSPASIDSAQQIASAADRAANLTRQLLTFSRQQLMQPRSVDLNEVVSKVNKMLQRVLGEDITLTVHYGSNLPPIRADVGMLEQVLLNLAVNSRDAMPRGGRLSLATSIARIDADYLQRNSEAQVGVFVSLAVSDTGCGISPENLNRIFEPFFTTKDVGKGTGLGLATVYGIIKQHSGWVEVSSELDRGSTFQIFLPAHSGALENNQETPEPKPAGGTETILVVEDEDPVRQLVRKILERQGYHVLQAESGVAALKVWDGYPGRVDLLLTDLVMPDGLSGAELARQLRRKQPTLKVLYTSGYSTEIFGREFVLDESVSFLQKPYQPVRLAKTVRECLDRTL